jgi:DNA invertase Pin-like site-specific DNA recombinase
LGLLFGTTTGLPLGIEAVTHAAQCACAAQELFDKLRKEYRGVVLSRHGHVLDMSPAGKLMLSMLAAVTEMERHLLGSMGS